MNLEMSSNGSSAFISPILISFEEPAESALHPQPTQLLSPQIESAELWPKSSPDEPARYIK